MAVSPTWVGPWVASRSWVTGKKGGGGGREIGNRRWSQVLGCSWGLWVLDNGSQVTSSNKTIFKFKDVVQIP